MDYRYDAWGIAPGPARGFYTANRCQTYPSRLLEGGGTLETCSDIANYYGVVGMLEISPIRMWPACMYA